MEKIHIEQTGLSCDEEFFREHAERIAGKIVHIIENPRTKLGSGQTAEVHYLDNEQICFKIINIKRDEEGVPFNSPEIEMNITNLLYGIDDDVRVPDVYYSAKYELSDEANVLNFKHGLRLLLMEKMNAVSLRNVLNHEADLPPAFDFETFFSKLRVFVEKMHSHGVYHRDLHDGNIMVDLVTGQPYVIDFGSATRAYGGDDNPYLDASVVGGIRYVSDEKSLLDVQKLIVNYLAKKKQVK